MSAGEVSCSRALVVDDDERMRRSLARLLRGSGSTVVEASSVKQALARTDEHFDLVITDVRLTDGSGVEVVRARSSRGQGAVIVAMSGIASASEAFELARAGAHVYLTKPFTREELLAGIAECVDRSVESEHTARSSADVRTGKSLEVLLEAFETRYGVSKREMELVRLAVAGVPRSQCPALLRVTDNTCKTMTRRLLQRCGARALSDIPRLLFMQDGLPARDDAT